MSRHSCRGRPWIAFKEECKRRARYRCERCKCRGRLEVHHIVPLSQGGERYSFDNVEVICRRCHFDEHRTDRMDAQRQAWRDYIGM